MLQIPVTLGARSYPIHVGRGGELALDELHPELLRRPKLAVWSRRVRALHEPRLRPALRRFGVRQAVELPDGERSKTLRTWASVHDALLAAGLGRDGVLVAIGGGVVGDLAGFAAATYMRGMDWVVLPTTLLSMVDSSIGGKVGLNHPAAKNLIGAFHQPRAVVADLAFLDTLAARERQSGGYEALKCGVIADPGLFARMASTPARLHGWDAQEAELAIAAACRVKAEIVSADEREGGLRRVLNLGHTLGHAFESVTAYRRFTHGEAVGWGLIAAAELARRRGLLNGADHQAIVAAVDHLGPRPRVDDLPAAALLAAVARDKKARAGRVPFILPEAIGRVAVHDDVTPSEIRGVLKGLGRG